MLRRKTIRFKPVHRLETLYLWYGIKGQPWVIWGHRGQILIFPKNALSPLCYVVNQCNSCICIRLTPLQMLLAQIPIGGTEVKRQFSPKMFLLQITWHCQVTHAYPWAAYLLQNLLAQTKWQNWHYQHAGYGQTLESVHDNLVRPPNLTRALGKGHCLVIIIIITTTRAPAAA